MSNILYVDDELENLAAFKAVFRRDYNIHTTASPTEALDYLHSHDVNLIITDQKMPEMTGVEFLKEVKEFIPQRCPGRIILSGYSKSSAIDEAYKKYNLCLFISKPWDPEELKGKIDLVLTKCA